MRSEGYGIGERGDQFCMVKAIVLLRKFKVPFI
jgi:hypothetical protein